MIKAINNIKFVREECHKTQQQCADFLGVSQKGYAWYESANRVYYDVLIRLSEFFGVPVDRLYMIQK